MADSESLAPKRRRSRKVAVAPIEPELPFAPEVGMAAEVQAVAAPVSRPNFENESPQTKLIKRRRTMPRRKAAGDVPAILAAVARPPPRPLLEVEAPRIEAEPSARAKSEAAPAAPVVEGVVKSASIKPIAAPPAKRPWPLASRLALTAFAAFLGGAGGHFAAATFAPPQHHVDSACVPDAPAKIARAETPK